MGLLCAGAAFLLVGCGSNFEATPSTDESVAVSSGGAAAGCATRAYPEIGGPVSLTNHLGDMVTEADYKGQHTMVFFGFTYCPDVCPMSLVTMKRAYDLLPESVTPPQTLLISIDPERDTPEKLADYISTPAFPENIQGLTGTPEQIRAAADNFVADYSRIEQPESLAEYTMDHTSLIYLMDEEWNLKTFFTHSDTDETMATCLEQLLD